MTDFHFSEVQVKVDNLCVILHNIARRQADGNFDYEALEKVRPKIAVQKWNGRLRRYETHFITTVDPMQSPSPEHPYHIEVPYGSRGEPVDVRLKRPFNGTKYANGTCRECGKKILRGITAKGKHIPISQEIDQRGNILPIAHREDCPHAKEFRRKQKSNIHFSNNRLF